MEIGPNWYFLRNSPAQLGCLHHFKILYCLQLFKSDLVFWREQEILDVVSKRCYQILLCFSPENENR